MGKMLYWQSMVVDFQMKVAPVAILFLSDVLFLVFPLHCRVLGSILF
jgi:hypothetical protein